MVSPGSGHFGIVEAETETETERNWRGLDEGKGNGNGNRMGILGEDVTYNEGLKDVLGTYRIRICLDWTGMEWIGLGQLFSVEDSTGQYNQ